MRDRFLCKGVVSPSQDMSSLIPLFRLRNRTKVEFLRRRINEKTVKNMKVGDKCENECAGSL